MKQFRLNDVRVDASGNRLERNGHVIRLEPKVMAVLCCLSESAGQVVSRAALLDRVWADQVVEDDALTSAVIKLRKALGDTARQATFIETVPKRGYRLIADLTTGREVESVHAIDGSASSASAEKPRIAVMNFESRAGNPEQQFLADGLAEDISRALSRIRWLTVISREGIKYLFAGEGGPESESDLNLDLVVRGSVRRAGQRIRVTVTLEHGQDRTQIWSERYDRAAADLFDVEDEICESLLGRLELEIGAELQRELLAHPHTSLTAWESYHRGLAARQGVIGVELTEAKAYFRRAIELDPAFAAPRAALALALVNELNQHVTHAESRKETIAEAEKQSELAVRLDPKESLSFVARARVRGFRVRFEAALTDAETALALNPNSAVARIVCAEALLRTDEPRRALEHIERVQELAPMDPHLESTLYGAGAMANLWLGKFTEAAAWARRGVEALPDPVWASAFLAVALLELGEREEATGVAADLVRRRPEFASNNAWLPRADRNDFYRWFFARLGECGISIG